MILMGGIAGIAESGMRNEVNRMLDKIAHRGNAARKVIESDNATIGAVYSLNFENLKSLISILKSYFD